MPSLQLSKLSLGSKAGYHPITVQLAHPSRLSPATAAETAVTGSGLLWGVVTQGKAVARVETNISVASFPFTDADVACVSLLTHTTHLTVASPAMVATHTHLLPNVKSVQITRNPDTLTGLRALVQKLGGVERVVVPTLRECEARQELGDLLVEAGGGVGAVVEPPPGG
eukprot:GDKI01018772.1.p2 GENE.GDKI01018772.1~~GDKI01018772.1.p2  ORF type:complete len:169 (+),score=66.37 GDKI01018772.1:785-1291(+)